MKIKCSLALGLGAKYGFPTQYYVVGWSKSGPHFRTSMWIKPLLVYYSRLGMGLLSHLQRGDAVSNLHCLISYF